MPNRKIHFILCLLLFATSVLAQEKKKPMFVTVAGTVYDITAKRPIESVLVFSTSGRGTITDSVGRYSFTVQSNDSIWFSMLNKNTIKYPIDTIQNLGGFDVMIHVRVHELPGVLVRNRSYKLDSIENRKDYVKVFNFEKPGLRIASPTYGGPAGVDLDEIINMFRFRYNRNMEVLQQRLIQQEQDHYVDHRFSKYFVRKITKLESPELDSFMDQYRPDYEVTKLFNDIELAYYIESCYEQYKANKAKQEKK